MRFSSKFTVVMLGLIFGFSKSSFCDQKKISDIKLSDIQLIEIENKITQKCLDKDFFKSKDGQEYFAKEYKEIAALNSKGFLTSIINYICELMSMQEDAIYAIMDPFQAVIKQTCPASYENPWKNVGASVRVGDPIGLQEMLYRDNRFPVVKNAQEKFLGMPLEKEDVLEIGFSCSGGGWRAMCCTTGSCVGAKKIGLFDTIMYISGLSGSTWFIGPWIYSGMDLYEYRKNLIEVASNGIKLKDPKEVATIFDNIWVKFAYDQPLNIVDLYGSLLANSLLRGISKDPHRVYLSDQRHIVDKGQFPMPIYTAVLGQEELPEHSFEFTPYEVGARWLKSYVPTWAFGRKFKEGRSKENAPEQYMGFMMGIFGSAFAADFKEIYDSTIDGMQVPKFLSGVKVAESLFNAIKKVLKALVYQTDVGDIRFSWARVPNFVYKLKGSEHSKFKEFKLVDSGVKINNPVFADYRRPPYGDAPDIIFVFDAGGSPSYNEVKLLVDYAKENKHKFPQVKQFTVGKQIMHVFKNDADLSVPVIVYMPRINGLDLLDSKDYAKVNKYYVDLLKGFDVNKATSSGFAKTFNFDYTKKDAETLMAMTEYNIVTVQNEIKKLMRERIELKRRIRA